MADVDTLLDFGESGDSPLTPSTGRTNDSSPPREGEPLDFDDLDPLSSSNTRVHSQKETVDFFTTVEYQSPSEPFGPSDGLNNDLLGDLGSSDVQTSRTTSTKSSHQVDLLSMENGHVTTTTTESYEDGDGVVTTTTVTETTEGEGDLIGSPQMDEQYQNWADFEGGDDQIENDDPMSDYPDNYAMPSWPPKAKPSESSEVYDGAGDQQQQQKDKNTLHYMKSRFEDKEKKQREKITRKPKKLARAWKEAPQEEEVGPGGKRQLPQEKEKDLLAFSTFGIDYSKTQYQKKVDDDVKTGSSTTQSLKPPSRQGDRNRSHSPSPVPVNWARVEKVAPPEITKNVRAIFETGSFSDIHKVRKTKVEDLNKIQGGIYENDPVQLEGVVRETDYNPEPDLIQEGTTKSIKERYLTGQGREVRKCKIVLAEGTGPECIENEPTRLEGVVRETDATSDTEILRSGLTKSKIHDYVNRSQERDNRSNQPISLVDGSVGPECVENEPVQLEGVVRETDSSLDGEVIQRGFARNVREQFMNRKDEVKSRGPINIREGNGPECVENEPQQRDDVIRESDNLNAQSDIIQRGTARNVREQYLKGNQREIKKLAINVREATGPECVENEPSVRDDVVREGDSQQEIIQKGYASNVKQQYLNAKGKEIKKIKVNLNEDEGATCESEPTVRDDVVRETDGAADTIEAGYTKNLKQRYLNYKGKEIKKTAVNLREADGPECFENEPEVRTDVVREADCDIQQDTIQQGYAKNLKNKYLNYKGKEVQKLQVNLAEAQGPSCVENEPTVRTDVVREADQDGQSDTVQRGHAESLKQKYLNCKGKEIQKVQVNLKEAEGPECIESTPEVRTDVVRETDYNPTPDSIQKGTAQNIKQQYLNYKGKEVKKIAVNLNEAQGPECIENTPEVRSDVVRETDYDSQADSIQRGTAQNIKQQYLNYKGREVKKTAVNLKEAQGPECIENTPEVRTDVVRETDYDSQADSIQRGTAQNIKQQYLNYKGREIKKTAVNLNEAQGPEVLENQPEVRTDVARETDYNPEPDTIQQGTAKNIKNQYLNYKGREIKKTTVNLNEDQGPDCVESTPEVREGVVRESDYNPEPDTIQQGTAKNIKQQYLNYKGREVKKTTVNLNEAQGPECVENNPEVREGVVRESDYNPAPDTIQQGTAKNIKQQYLNYKGREVKKTTVDLNEAQGPECVENTPEVREGVVRESDYNPAPDTIQQGSAKNIKHQYLNYKGKEIKKTAVNLNEAQGPECVENTPEVREGVVRESDYNPAPDTIQQGTAKNIKHQYLNYKGKEVQKTAVNLNEAQGPDCIENTPEVRTDVVRETDYDSQADTIQRGTAQNIKQQYLNSKGKEIKKIAVNLNEAQGPEFVENNPEVREGVVRESDYNPEPDTIHKGTAQNIKQQYLSNKGKEIKKIAVNLNEAQGPECVENNPEVREGVVRESDYNPEPDTIHKGTAQNIKHQYLNNKGKEIKKIAVNLNEAQGPECVENNPEVREGVVRESDYNPDSDTITRGYAKNVKNQYLNYKGKQVEKCAINLNEATGPECVENNPEVRQGVIRESDYNAAADTVVRGTAQSKKQQYLNDKGRQVEKTAINLYEAQGPEVLENQPEVRTDVIRETDYDPESDAIQRGVAQVAKQQFLNDKGNPVQRTEIEKWENEESCYENNPEVRQDVVREVDTRYISPSEASIPEGVTGIVTDSFTDIVTDSATDYYPSESKVSSMSISLSTNNN